MRLRYRFDMHSAYDAGATGHPQAEIRKFFPDASNWEPIPIADCWLFDAEEKTAIPSFFRCVGVVR